MSFITNVKCTVNYGPYEWCSNVSESGCFLTNKKDVSNKLMIKIEFNLPQELLDKIDAIECYDSTGFLAQYTYWKLLPNTKLFYEAHNGLDSQNTDILIKYVKNLPRKNNRRLSRPPTNIIYSEKILTPQLSPHGCNDSTKLDCSICLEKCHDMFISSCGHSFHIQCLWEYLETNKKLIPLSEHCFNYCEHEEKTNSFNCPICRQLLNGQ